MTARRSPPLPWALLVLSSLIYFGFINDADNDLWWHLFTGRIILAQRAIPQVDSYSYTAAGLPWFNHEWLSHVLLAQMYDFAGSAGLVLSKLALTLLMFALTWYGIVTNARPRRSASDLADQPRTAEAEPQQHKGDLAPWLWGCVSLLTLAVLSRGLAIRPQIVTYALLAATLAMLDAADRGRRQVLWTLPPLFLLWVNLHGGFILGIVVLAWYCGWRIVAALLPGKAREPLRLGEIWPFVLAGLVTLINPHGYRLYSYLQNELTRSHPISEWQPVHLGSEHAPFFLMLAALIVTLPLARDWRHRAWRTTLALIVGIFALRQQRHTPVFALCAAAPLAIQLRLLSERLGERGLQIGVAAQRLIELGVLLLALVQLAFTTLRLSRDGLQITFDRRDYPTAAVAALKAGAAHGNLAVPLDWGAYVLWHLQPAVRPSIDGRFATVYPEQVVADNFAFFEGGAQWRRLLDVYPTEAALLPAGAALPISREPGWQRVYTDEVASLYVRSDRRSAFAVGAAAPTDGVFP